DMTELVSGARPPREDASHRAAIIHPGHAIGILALAALIHDRARAAGRGTPLPQ
ncbi:MAG: 2,3-diaminopropionate biosynthesis protein SbnB, partial [Rhodospirillaceae bacterium]|nr:2,3-diaminopropionate biosynthesis protein SbnB [Rhodospirillaceae bacterium]